MPSSGVVFGPGGMLVKPAEPYVFAANHGVSPPKR